jgi:tetratricopeptide (TPR) repeat protein
VSCQARSPASVSRLHCHSSPTIAGNSRPGLGVFYMASLGLPPLGLAVAGMLLVSMSCQTSALAQSARNECAQGFGDTAIAACDRAIAANPNDWEAFYYRGFEWGKKGNHDKAIADLDEAVRLNPKDSKVYVARGFAWAGKRDHDKAIADFTEAVRLNPNDAEAYIVRGFAWVGKGDYDKAIADCSEAIRLDAKHPSAYLNRGFAWVGKGDHVTGRSRTTARPSDWRRNMRLLTITAVASG